MFSSLSRETSWAVGISASCRTCPSISRNPMEFKSGARKETSRDVDDSHNTNAPPSAAVEDDSTERMEAMCARSEEHTSELQSLMRISYAVFCLTKKIIKTTKYN